MMAAITKAYLQKTSLFLRYRIAAHEHLLKQMYLHSETGNEIEETQMRKTFENVCAIIQIQDFSLLP